MLSSYFSFVLFVTPFVSDSESSPLLRVSFCELAVRGYGQNFGIDRSDGLDFDGSDYGDFDSMLLE